VGVLQCGGTMSDTTTTTTDILDMEAIDNNMEIVTGVAEETPVVTEEEQAEMAAPVTGVTEEEQTPIVTEEEEEEAPPPPSDEDEEEEDEVAEEGLRHRIRHDSDATEEERPFLPLPTSPLLRQVGVTEDDETDDERPDRLRLVPAPPLRLHLEEMGDSVPIPLTVLLIITLVMIVYLMAVAYLLSWNCPALIQRTLG
jgi:hypothetical protein